MAKNNILQISQGERLKKVLEKKDIKAAHLAKDAGVGHLTEMIKGSKPINNQVIYAIMTRCDLGPLIAAWILTGEQQYNIFTIVNNDKTKNKQVPYPNLVALFIQKNLAWELNYSLIELEKINPAALKDVQDYINFKIFEFKTNEKDSPKKSTTMTGG